VEQGRVCFEDKDHRTLNINRQAGRRRGRGGQRQGGNPNGGNNGNRIDNRARGNANQLLEKYKALAAEAQRQGDRVNTEYYLQFADHYFRVLAENRSRFEDQNPNQNQQRRGRDEAFDDEDEGFEEDGNSANVEASERYERRDREPREQRPAREVREPRSDRYRQPNGQDADTTEAAASEQPAQQALDIDAEPAAVQDEPAPKRRGRPRRTPAVETNEGEVIDADRLPPSLGFAVGNEGEEVAPKPRRRTRRTAANETSEAADAAE